MSNKFLFTPGPKNMSLVVNEQLPQGFVEDAGFSIFFVVRTARNWNQQRMHFCPRCNGWILGEPNEHEENSMSYYHPLSGRSGMAYWCRRCGYEIAFVGMVS